MTKKEEVGKPTKVQTLPQGFRERQQAKKAPFPSFNLLTLETLTFKYKPHKRLFFLSPVSFQTVYKNTLILILFTLPLSPSPTLFPFNNLSFALLSFFIPLPCFYPLISFPSLHFSPFHRQYLVLLSHTLYCLFVCLPQGCRGQTLQKSRQALKKSHTVRFYLSCRFLSTIFFCFPLSLSILFHRFLAGQRGPYLGSKWSMELTLVCFTS